MATLNKWLNTTVASNPSATGDSSSDPYTSWSAFISDAGGEAASGDTVNCYITGYFDNGSSSLVLNTFNAGVILNLIADTGQSCEGRLTQGAGVTSSSTSRTMLIYCGTRFQGLRIRNSSTGHAIQFTHDGTKADLFRDAYIKGTMLYGSSGNGGSHTAENSVFDAGSGDYLTMMSLASGNYTVKQIASVLIGRMNQQSRKTITQKNCIYPNSANPYVNTVYTSTTINVSEGVFNTASSASSTARNGTQSGNTFSVSFTGYFTDTASGDYYPTSTGFTNLAGALGTSDADIPSLDAEGTGRGSGSATAGPFEAATGYTLTGDQASFALSGQAVTLTASRLLDAAQTTFALTGQLVSFGYSRVLALDNGAYSLGGQDVALQAARSLTSDSAAFTLSGQDAGLLALRLVAADYATFSLVGQDVQFGNNLTMTGEFAAFAMAGQALGLAASRLLTADHSSFAVSGQDAGFSRLLLLTAEFSAFLVSGQQVGLVITRQLAAAYGAFVLAGQAASLIYAQLGIESVGAIAAVFVFDTNEPVFMNDAAEAVVVNDVPGVVWI